MSKDLDRYIQFTGYMEDTYKIIQKIKSDHMKFFRLRGTDATLILMLGRHPEGLTATQLASKCKVDKAVVSRALKPLFEAQTVKYADGTKSNYRSQITLTEKGQTIFESVLLAVVDAVGAANKNVTDKDLLQFYKTLHKLNHNLKEYAKGNEA